MINQKRLKQLLAYYPSSGKFRWRAITSNRVSIGDSAGSLSCGYIRISIDGVDYLAHRLAWFYVHGNWPTDQIDHINGVRTDNRIINLREATPSINTQNQRRALGAYFDRGKYRAQIRINGIQTYLGRFSTARHAHQAYVSAKRKFHTGCTV